MGVSANRNSSLRDGDWLTSKQSGIFFAGAKAVPTGERSLILNEKLGILMRIRGWPEEHRALGMWGRAAWGPPAQQPQILVLLPALEPSSGQVPC